jgi:hypothetical protein
MTRSKASLEFYREHLRGKPLMIDTLATLGISVNRSRQIRNPSYPDRHPSVYVYDDHLTDFGGDQKPLDCLAVCMDWGNMTLESAVALLARLAGLDAPTRAPVRFEPIKARPLPPVVTSDPAQHATFAAQTTAAFQSLSSRVAQTAFEYLASRGLHESPFLAGVGVVDHTVTAPLPSSTWGGLLTFPTWTSGTLGALKGRNTVADKAKRIMRNLAGARVPLYNLEPALQASDRYLLLVEGETDTLSVLESGVEAVAGIAGVNNWRKSLEALELGNRHLMVALDGDDAGVKATTAILEWAAAQGIPAHPVDCGDADKNELLGSLGPSGLRDHLNRAMWAAFEGSRARVRRTLL